MAQASYTHLGEADQALAQVADHGAVALIAAHADHRLLREALWLLEELDGQVDRAQLLVLLLLRQ